MSNKKFQKKSNDTENDDLDDALAKLSINSTDDKASSNITNCNYNTHSQKNDKTSNQDSAVQQNDNDEISNKQYKVGLAYDPNMLRHRHPIRHVECPERISKTWNLLELTGIVDRCKLIPSRNATEDELMLVHSGKHIDNLKHNTLPLAELAADDLFWNKFKSYMLLSVFLIFDADIHMTVL